MGDEVRRDHARDPQDLERLLVTRQRLGDLQGMAALYEQDAVLNPGDGQLIRGKKAIEAFFGILVSQGRKFEFGDQRAAIIAGDLALTSTRLPNGTVTAEIARRQSEGTWLWVVDQFSVA
jgi:ketosteroid isomerase-like protein